MIDPRIIKLLDSSSTETRIKAVKALAKTADPDALPYLAKVYREDQDASVREMARKGGLYIKQQAEAAPPVVEGDDDDGYGYGDGDGYGYAEDDDDIYGDDDEKPYDYGDEELPEDTPLPSDIKVSQANQDLAQSYLNQAMDWNVRGDDKKSVQFLQRALKANPRLVEDTYTVSLAASITGKPGKEAVRDLMQEKPKRGSGGGSSRAVPGEVTWGDVTIDMAIYMLVVAIGIFAIFYLSFSFVSTLITGPEAEDFAELTAEDFGIVALLIIGLITGLSAVFSLVLQGVGIHIAAVIFLGGEGTLKNLFRKITPFNTIITFIGLVIFALILATLPGTIESATATTTTTTTDADGSSLILLFACGGFFAGIGVFFYYCRLVAQVYDFSTVTGCGAVIVGGIISGILSSILSSVLGDFLNSLATL